MPIPPPSIILILALGGLDSVLTGIAVLGLGYLGAGAADSSSSMAWMGTLLAFFAAVGAVHVALKVAALVGLYMARRWAVIVGAVAFSISWPLVFVFTSAPGASLSVLAVATTAIFLACTLPHWRRMT